MKVYSFFALLAFLIFPQFNWAQSLEDQLINLMYPGFSRYENALERIQEIIEVAQKVAQKNNIETEVIELNTEYGSLKTYPALRILPSDSSIANKEALEIATTMGNLPLVFSPYDLDRIQANAFFRPKGDQIGVPKEFILNQISSSYYHEVYHAKTYLKLIQKKDDTYAGWFKLINGDRMSDESHDTGYVRKASLDEMMATGLSVKLLLQQLYSHFKSMPYKEFIKNDKNQELLSEIHFSLKNVIGLASQSADLLTQAAKKIKKDDYEVYPVEVQLGNLLSRNVSEVKILVNSSIRVFERGRGIQVDVPNGTEVILRCNSVSKNSVLSRLDTITKKSLSLENKYRRAYRLIKTHIVRVDLENTNIRKLYQSVFSE